MNIPTIQISQQFGQIGIKITQPNLKLRIDAPNLNVHTQQSDLNLRITHPEVIINLHESFDSMGLKDIGSLQRSISVAAKQTSNEGIDRRVREGIELEKANGPSVIQLADAASKPKELQLGIGLMPDAPPQITVQDGSIKGTFSQGGVSVKLNSGDVIGDFTWGKVDVYMEREPYIDIRA